MILCKLLQEKTIENKGCLDRGMLICYSQHVALYTMNPDLAIDVRCAVWYKHQNLILNEGSKILNMVSISMALVENNKNERLWLAVKNSNYDREHFKLAIQQLEVFTVL